MHTADMHRPTIYIAARLMDYVRGKYWGLGSCEPPRRASAPDEQGYTRIDLEFWLHSKSDARVQATLATSGQFGDVVTVSLSVEGRPTPLSLRVDMASEEQLKSLCHECCEAIILAIAKKL